jgi:hypothetical protein
MMVVYCGTPYRGFDPDGRDQGRLLRKLPGLWALLDTRDLGPMLAHVYDAEIAKARSRRRAKLVAVGSQNKPAGVNRRAMCGRSLSANPQIFRGRFAPVVHLFIAHLGTLIEVAQAGSFHGRDVHKHVLAAVVGLNKSKSLSRIEPLHNTCRHVTLSLGKTIVAVKG